MGLTTHGMKGANAAQQASGGILGMLFGGINDRSQLKQQEKLNALQIKANREMLDIQSAKQLEMWEKTNAKAQKEQYKIAGLNPALMYGMSGGGGLS